MSGSQVWRVACEDGTVHDVQVTDLGAQGFTAMSGYSGGEFDHQGWGDTARQAIVELCTPMRAEWEVVQILAPGAMTESERVAAETARCAAVCREVTARYRSGKCGCIECDGRGDGARECAEAIERGPVTP